MTAAFNYRTNPRLIAEFLWRFGHLSPKQRGHDVSIPPANLAPDVDTRVRKQPEIKNRKTLLFKFELPGLDGIRLRPEATNAKPVAR